MKIWQSTNYSQKHAKCGEENDASKNRNSYNLNALIQ